MTYSTYLKLFILPKGLFTSCLEYLVYLMNVGGFLGGLPRGCLGCLRYLGYLASYLVIALVVYSI
jgi:hypothetical protein